MTDEINAVRKPLLDFIAELQSENTGLLYIEENLNHRFNESEKQVVFLRNELKRSGEDIDILKNKLKTKEVEMMQLSKDIEQARSSIDNLYKEKAGLEHDMSQLESDRNMLWNNSREMAIENLLLRNDLAAYSASRKKE